MTNKTISVVVTAMASLMSLPVAAEGVKIDETVVASPVSDQQGAIDMKAVRALYEFWNTGDENLLKQALAANFTDRTLPPGRPQGPEGPAFASRQFRGAVPDLKVEVEKMIVAGSYVTVHMKFTGHFTGKLGQTLGSGQEINFIATDLVKLEDGRIADNWHIEDNLTLLRQMGVAYLDP
jgi:predicted ester cyclase